MRSRDVGKAAGATRAASARTNGCAEAGMVETFAGIEACIPALRRYAFALLRGGQDADDLVHDTLLRALDNLPARRNDGDIRPWLFTIMHNLFVSQRRRAKASPVGAPLDEEDEDAVSQPADQEDGLGWRDLIRAVHRLPQDQSCVVLLVCVEDMSYTEVARVLGIPIGTVMSRLARAREKLRQALPEQGGSRACLRRVK